MSLGIFGRNLFGMQYVGGDRKAQSCRFHRHLLSAQTRFPYHNFSQKLTKCILYLAQVLRQIMEQKFIPDGGYFGISFLSTRGISVYY